MRYLAISRSPNYIAYAVFDDEVFTKYNIIYFKYIDLVGRLKNIYELFKDLLEKEKPSIVVSHTLDVEKILKKDLAPITEVRSLIKLACMEEKVVYLEASTKGWEKKILGRVTKARKLELIKNGYDLDLKDMEPYTENVADAIILGEGIAHKRLFV